MGGHTGFWAALDQTECDDLEHAGRQAVFEAGTVLCQELQPAGEIMVIRRGSAEVFVGKGAEERLIARRGPGDLVGEGAVLRVRSRSATMVAAERMEALVLDAEAFGRFLEAHPRVISLLAQQLTLQPADNGLTWAGRNCTIVFTDIAGYSDTHRDDEDRLLLRRSMYAMLREAFDRSEIPWAGCYHEDRGDGALVVIPHHFPTASFVDPGLALLAAGLRRHNRRSSSVLRIQLRVALTVGPVVPDDNGISGEAIIEAARLLEAPELKRRLVDENADLGVIVSAFVYDTVVKHGPGLVEPETYSAVEFKLKKRSFTGWMSLTGSSKELDVARPAPPPVSAPQTAPVFNGKVNVQGDLIMGNKIEYR